MNIIYISSNPDNFRNFKYLDKMEEEFKTMFRAYHKYMSYRSKLLNELTMDEQQCKRVSDIDAKFVKNLKRASKRIQKEDFKGEEISR